MSSKFLNDAKKREKIVAKLALKNLVIDGSAVLDASLYELDKDSI